eukprot:CAMPEP_0167748806 /NCGR_PEP_ID=MMETSP0110_2-20121227/5045_1 /TAXON_ID=629695 /ORGANISM="Gymnochlora sp., Strain CCMP2014" /LENGTH=138 /DNA_ID=CAMNT_0007633867 /DNA_START=351 /DNA_END=767 /DNA_ORIENTATION=+
MTLFKNNDPIPEYPGKVVSIKSEEKWEELRKECKDSEKHLVCDIYADWCGPCRYAAPHYAKMSQEYDEKKVAFAKINYPKIGRQLRDVAVTAFPTFKIYDPSGTCVVEIRGFDMAKIEASLTRFGLNRGSNKESKKSM